MNKTEVIEHFSELGFTLEEIPDYAYIFHYEDLNMLYMPDDEDNDFFRIALPNIYDVTEENRAFLLDVANETNLMIKSAKICLTHDDVWAMYECPIFSEDKIENMIQYAAELLQAASALFIRNLNGEGFGNEEDNNDEKQNDK
ncbi:MAG: hypothetical protein LKF31_02985 [Muribaculaceae bacterium]|jgi:hypothetical protein|nr:hypothetical protein [Muribaculaceae bacterium]